MNLDSYLAVVIFLNVFELVSCNHTVRQFDSAENLLVILLLELAVKGNLIYLFLVIRRIGQLLRYLTVIGEHEDSCSVLVKTSDREHS